MMWKKTKNSLNGKETQKNIKKTNRDIWFTGIFFSVLFVAMMGYYAHFVHTQGDEMINSSYNSRQKLLKVYLLICYLPVVSTPLP